VKALDAPKPSNLVPVLDLCKELKLDHTITWSLVSLPQKPRTRQLSYRMLLHKAVMPSVQAIFLELENGVFNAVMAHPAQNRHLNVAASDYSRVAEEGCSS
jgi:hypothetical protein